MQPLVDDPKVPLDLQSFVEHPSSISVAANKTALGGGGSTGATVYLFDSTAISASLGGNYEPARSLATLSGGVGLLDYLTANVRAGLGYLGSRSYESLGYFSSDGARALLAVLLGGRLDDHVPTDSIWDHGASGRSVHRDRAGGSRPLARCRPPAVRWRRRNRHRRAVG